MRRILSALIVAATAVVAWAHPQNPQRAGDAAPPTGLLMGVAVDSIDGQPVPNAEVTLVGAPAGTRNTLVMADANGRFVFMDLPKGDYTITATKPGYADGAFGRRRPAGLLQTLTLADAERIGDLRIPLWKLAAITGRVVDESGEAMVGIPVRALQRTVLAGRIKLLPGPVTRTDDRGVYRIGTLTPAEYAIVIPATQASAPQSVVDRYRAFRGSSSGPGEEDFYRQVSMTGLVETLSLFDRHEGSRLGTLAFISTGANMRASVAPMPSGDARLHVYPALYYAGAPVAAEASIITLRPGEERAGADVQVRLVATSRVSGTVTGPEGLLVAALSLVPEGDDAASNTGLETATTISDATGKFTFFGVPEGRYRLRAVWLNVPAGGGGSRGAAPPAPAAGRPNPQPAPPPLPSLGGFTLWSTQSIVVGSSDTSNLAITMRAGFRVSGRAEFIGAATQPAPDVIRRMTTTFDPADARPLVSSLIGRGQFDEKGQLSSYQMLPGRYYVRANGAPGGWRLKSATVGGRDVSNLPLTLENDVSGLVVTFTDRFSSLSGQVQSATTGSDINASVLIFPADAAAWTDTGGFPRQLRAIRVNRQGQFETTGLPAGAYLAVAVDEESTANWQDPRVLKSLARVATSFALAENETRSLALRTQVLSR